MKVVYLFLILILSQAGIYAQKYVLSGMVLDSKKEPMEFVSVQIEGFSLGDITDKEGRFTITNIPSGTYFITTKCLGYTDSRTKVVIDRDIKGISIQISEQTLSLKEVVVTAERKASESINSSYTLNNTALEHMQSTSIYDALSLLPGEQSSKYKSLTSAKQIISLRGDRLEIGNPAFGSVTEIDGVRLSTNSYYDTSGYDLRNLGNNNVERIEVISGVPSVEYGDLTNGIVKIFTRKGKSPYHFNMSIRPNTQVYSVSKGLDMGKSRGIINLSYEYGKSISDIASPYTSYTRNSFGLKYSNTSHFASGRNMSYNMTLNGNFGLQDSKSDPDAFKDTYSKAKDNLLISSLSLDCNVNSVFLSNIKLGADFSFADRIAEAKINKSSSSAYPAIHTMDDGYYVASKYGESDKIPNIILLQPGYWYTTSFLDDKPLNCSFYGKLRWEHKLWNIHSSLLAGTEFRVAGNNGQGLYYSDISLAPDWREYRYDELPFVYNISSYMEEVLKWGVRNSYITVSLGLRYDTTVIPKSEYSNVGSFSPRLNARYNFTNDNNNFFKGGSIRLGWGKAFKLPSFEILYPKASYSDRLVFTAPTLNDGSTYYAYHTKVSKPIYNENLKWQSNILRDIGLDLRFKGFSISLSAFYNSMVNTYSNTRIYNLFDYKKTDQTHLENIDIPDVYRTYSIDKESGIVSVHDNRNNGIYKNVDYKVIRDFNITNINVNGGKSDRWGLEFIIDIDKIKPINTSIRIDGKYYHYKGIDEILIPSTTGLTDKDGQPYKYIGYYAGGSGNYNGFETEQLNSNITFITHIPKMKMIFSLRLECTLLNTRQNISQQYGLNRSYPLDSKNDYLPSTTKESIYGGYDYVVTYPMYYVSRDDMDNKIPFKEKLIWAYDNDKILYEELSKLAIKSSTGYIFARQGYTPYFTANLNVTKEIGKNLTVSFFANNFLYTMQRVKNKQTGNYFTLFGSGLVTPFNYGISFKLKI